MEKVIYIRVERSLTRKALRDIPKEARLGSKEANDLMLRCGVALLKIIRDAFIIKARGGTDAAGDNWKPLAPATLARRKIGSRGSKRRGRLRSVTVEILHDTGELLNSLTPHYHSSASTFRVTPGSISIGTSRKGAMTHHYGSPKKGIPQRRLWPEISKWPSVWWNAILKEAQLGLIDITVKLVRSARK